MLRINLSGRMTIESDGRLLGPGDFPGQQGRTAFAFLVCNRGVPVSRPELAEVLWPGELPPAWDGAISSIASKLRALLAEVGLPGSETLRTGGGCYELGLPADTRVDHEVAADSIHEAEAALRAGEPARAYGPSAVAHHIARRPFLPGESGPWVEQRRDRLTGILVRALECRAEIYLWNGEHPLAIELAQDLVARQPFLESGHRLLMRAHAGAGNTAEALRVYERCRALISDELGVGPSPETRALHDRLLKSL